MKIEKKKLITESKWSSATKSGLAAIMGLTPSAIMVACDEDSISGTVAVPLEEFSSSSYNAETSSSGQVVVDIPKSSSSVDMELLSSSSWDREVFVVGMPPPIDDDEMSSSSSEPVPVIEAGVIAPIEDPDSTLEIISSSSEGTSSSFVEEVSSSSENAESSSSDSVVGVSPASSSNVQENPYDSYIHLCPNDGSECYIASMVTTFERTDIDV